MQYGFKGGILRIKSTVYLKIFHVRQQTESYQERKLKNACVCGWKVQKSDYAKLAIQT